MTGIDKGESERKKEQSERGEEKMRADAFLMLMRLRVLLKLCNTRKRRDQFSLQEKSVGEGKVRKERGDKGIS
jgi:hypothetical protein